MKNLTLMISLFSLSIAFAGSNKNFHSKSEMEVVSTRFGFETAQNVVVKLFTNDKGVLSNLDIIWEELDAKGNVAVKKKKLVVDEILTEGDVEVLYASLPVDVSLIAPAHPRAQVAERFSVVLRSYLGTVLAEGEPLWRVSVRQGFGFCGTCDAVMELEGDPVFEWLLLADN